MEMIFQAPEYTVESRLSDKKLEERLNLLVGHGVEVVAITQQRGEYTLVWCTRS